MHQSIIDFFFFEKAMACDSDDLSKLVNSAIENITSRDYCIDEMLIKKGNNKIKFKISKNSHTSPEDDFDQACGCLFSPNSISDRNVLPFRETNLSPLDLNKELILSPCKVLSSEQQKLLKWKSFYDVDQEGNYLCKHCPNQKKFTTSKWLVHHLEKVAKRNSENQASPE